MSELRTLRHKLRRLGWSRWVARVAAAWSVVAAALLCGLLLVGFADWYFELKGLERLVLAVLAGLGVVWVYWRFARPHLGWRESPVRLALLLEASQGLSSDLVAAMQFEQLAAAGAESPQLRRAVVRRASQLAPRLQWGPELGTRIFQGRLALAAGLAVAAGLVFAAYPRHVEVFFNRLAQGSAHYPSRTRLLELVINGEPVLRVTGLGQLQPDPARCAEGRPVEFLLLATGETPAQAVAELRVGASRNRLPLKRVPENERVERLQAARDQLAAAEEDRRIPLTRTWSAGVAQLLRFDWPQGAVLLDQLAGRREKLPEILEALDKRLSELPPAGGGKSWPTQLYQAVLERNVGSFAYQITAGDAFTDPGRVEMIELPLVESFGRVQPPAYTDLPAEELARDVRQFAVLEGARVELGIRAINKPLREVVLLTEVEDAAARFPLQTADEGMTWTLAADQGPFARVAQPAKFEIQATDIDGLTLEEPLEGFVRIRSDLPPRGVTTIVHRVVLPQATPQIDYRVNDDYGISQVRLLVTVERAADPRANGLPAGEDAGAMGLAAPGNAGEMRPANAPPAAEPSPADPSTPVPPATPAAGQDPATASSGPAGDSSDSSSSDSSSSDSPGPAPSLKTRSYLVLEGPIRAAQLPRSGKYPLELSGLALAKGDRVKISLEVVDYRGAAAGVVFRGEPLALEVSDESGVLSAISEADEQSERRLNELIQRQLGIGDSE